MAGTARIRREKRLAAAQGYLMLEMPDQALRELQAIDDPGRCLCQFSELRGEALRQKGEYDSALQAFSIALDKKPTNVSILMGMAWCYKRTGQLAKAIAATEEAYRIAPREPVLLYNLACYFALAGEKSQALSWLGRALRMDASLRKLIPSESDFDRLRGDPDFEFIVTPPRDLSSRS